MQLKSLMNKKGADFNVPAQMVLQHYVMERFLDRIARSSFRHCFILKGGLLISTLIGMAARTTLDMDTTVRGLEVTPQVIRETFEAICQIPSDDDFLMELIDLKEIREEAEYPGLRVSLTANYGKMKVPFTMDVTTGDAVTPEAVV